MPVPSSFFHRDPSMRLRAEGRADARIEDLLLVLDARGISVSQDALDLIAACLEQETLRLWLRRAATADTLDDVFAD
ncbi:hypothetical protein ACFPM3_30115 [Streptomyces coeruleoprunus]|uniref:Uncharacterized protein n=1 Tax=Streptomyces coeruleoprunus TaxID=285563 RepID=A0ABV9XQ70_9ACTN